MKGVKAVKGYKVSVIDPMGIENNESYYIGKQKARSEVARRLWQLRKNSDLDRDRKCMIGERPIHFEREPLSLFGAVFSATFWLIQRCSYEYEEYDSYPYNLCLWEIEITE